MRLSEKIDTLVTLWIAVRAAKVPPMARIPTASGRLAAMRLPKTNTSNTSVIGNGDALGFAEVVGDGVAQLAEHGGLTRGGNVDRAVDTDEARVRADGPAC